MTITKWDYPKVCEVTHTGKVVRGAGLFEVSQESGTTYFTWTEYVELPFGLIGKIGWLAVKPLTLLGLKQSLKKFKRINSW